MTSGMCNCIAPNTKMSLEIVFGTQKNFASVTAADSIKFVIRGPPEGPKLNFKVPLSALSMQRHTYVTNLVPNILILKLNSVAKV